MVRPIVSQHLYHKLFRPELFALVAKCGVDNAGKWSQVQISRGDMPYYKGFNRFDRIVRDLSANAGTITDDLSPK